ncbi:MAG: DUF3488 and transglutaminase-like domain-containing protein [Planctomycetaceae bacterium]|jgi:hypothetical protein|nr:DUF3488 and transglutaminase-like domain-containing protein [Planctomycetaceae bacterium]
MLSVMPCLSTLMLGIGQDDILLPVLMLLAACLSLYVTDYKRLIQLGDWTVNVLIVIIVFMTIGDILHHWGEALAISIVRTLVFVEIVLLFRRKDSKLCWQILLISLLQVLVASAMQQSMLFGVILVIYLFIGLCTLTLLFLRNENLYYQRHSFVPSLFEIVREEIATRQDYGRLVRLALLTLFTGPIALAMSFSPRKPPDKNTTEIEIEKQNLKQQKERWDILRTFFAVFSKEPNTKTGTETSKHSALQNNTAIADKNSQSNGLKIPEAGRAITAVDGSNTVLERTWVQAPSRKNKRSKKRNENEKEVDNADNNYPFFHELPSFSAGTMCSVGLMGNAYELIFRLFRSTFGVMFIAAVLFFIIPRIGKIDFWQINWTFGNSRWETAFIPRVGAIGFREEIRLGSLGSILPYHSEVMTVRFNKTVDGRVPKSDAVLNSYNEIEGASLYFRGIALTKYSNGIWKPQDEQQAVSQIMTDYNNGRQARYERNIIDKSTNPVNIIIETINENINTYIKNLSDNNTTTTDTDNTEKINNINNNNVRDRFANRFQRRNRGSSNWGYLEQTNGDIRRVPFESSGQSLDQRSQMFFRHPLFGVRPGLGVDAGEGEDLFFENDSDLVQLNMSILPLDTSVFFAPWPFFTTNVTGIRRGLLSYSHGSLHETRSQRARYTRQIYSTGFKKGNQLQLIPCQEPFAVDDMFQVPARGLDALIELAKEWDRESGIPKENIIGRAKYFERQFLESGKFCYQLGGTKRDYELDPLEDFIKKNNNGHCEYFAGALAMMLRSVGIGTRVIVGFKTEAVKLSASEVGCMVRQSDAHSWVEVFVPQERLPSGLWRANADSENADSATTNNRTKIPNGSKNNPYWWDRGGWLRLDPTPFSVDNTLMTKFSFGLTDLVNMVKNWWNYGVLNMNSERQVEWVYKPAWLSGQYLYEKVFKVEFWQEIMWGIIDHYKSLILNFSSGKISWSIQDVLLLVSTALLALVIVFIGLFILRRLRLLRWRRVGKASISGTVEFYLRMEYILSKYNRQRYPYETPLEYIRLVSPFELTSFILDAYYGVRYGEAKLTTDELQTIKISLDELEKELEKGKQLSKQFDA